ncbi:hypothetical protein ACMC56_15965 [Campylobacterota bacterium DY0563]
MVSSATILIKTPKLKFYDKGFISIYNNYTQVEILTAGTTILKLKMYEDKICKDFYSCQSFKSFNKEFLNENYKETFIKDLFERNEKNTIFRDKENNILIKIQRD